MKKNICVLILLQCLTFTAVCQEGFIGEVKMFAGNFAPTNWAFCEGQLLSISSYEALFSILGTTYGGDGRTTFALPDLRGRVPVQPGAGPGLSPIVLGQRWGIESVVMTTAQLPAHTHSATMNSGGSVSVSTQVSTKKGTSSIPENGYMLAAPPDIRCDDVDLYISESDGSSSTVELSGISGSLSDLPPIEVGSTGWSEPVYVSPPSLAINFIICLQGIYPSRD